MARSWWGWWGALRPPAPGGWAERGDGRVWSVFAGYGGGDIAQWAREIPDGGYWDRLDTNIANNDRPGAVWWQLCDLANDNGTTADAEAVVAEISKRLPGVRIYASPLAEFESPATCVKQDIDNSNALVDHLVSRGLSLRGPDLPIVRDAWIQPPQGNGRCHVGPNGTEQFGASLATFDWFSG